MSSQALTSDERETLRQFCRISSEIVHSRFFKEYRQRSCAIFIGTLPNGTRVDQYPRYDKEDFKAFVLDYRKLRANSEDTNVARVMNLLRIRVSSCEQEAIRAIKRELHEEGNAWWGVTVHLDGSPDPVLLSSVEIEKYLFNASAFHTDKDKRPIWEQIERHGPFWEHAFLRFAMFVVDAAQKLGLMAQSHL